MSETNGKPPCPHDWKVNGDGSDHECTCTLCGVQGDPCEACAGTGNEDSVDDGPPCPKCKGSGMVPYVEPKAETTTPPVEEPVLAKIFELNREVSARSDDYIMKKEAASSAKKLLEAATEQLNWYIRKKEREHEEQGKQEAMPLFDKPAPPPESWRETPIADLSAFGLSSAIVGKLTDQGVGTIGALADWTNTGKLLTDLDGIGPGKAAQIEEALTAYWAKHSPADSLETLDAELAGSKT